MQDESGILHELAGMVQSVEMYEHSEFANVVGDPLPVAVNTQLETTIRIIGVKDGYSQQLVSDWIADIAEGNKTNMEWRCEFCGQVNLREHRKCEECNSARSFLYELVKE
jgi:hypothetical protein